MLVYCLTRDHELAAAIENAPAAVAGLLLQRRGAPAPGRDPAPARCGGDRHRRGARGVRGRRAGPGGRLPARTGRRWPGWRCGPTPAPSGWSRPRQVPGCRCFPLSTRPAWRRSPPSRPRCSPDGPMRPGGQHRPTTRQRRSARSTGPKARSRCLPPARRQRARRSPTRGRPPDALDQLARWLPRVRGKHDLAGARATAPVGQAFDEQAIPGEQRRGHRAAAHLDQVEPSASRHGRCADRRPARPGQGKGPDVGPSPLASVPGRSGRASADARLLRAAGRLPHLVDRVDHEQQLLAPRRHPWSASPSRPAWRPSRTSRGCPGASPGARA